MDLLALSVQSGTPLGYFRRAICSYVDIYHAPFPLSAVSNLLMIIFFFSYLSKIIVIIVVIIILIYNYIRVLGTTYERFSVLHHFVSP